MFAFEQTRRPVSTSEALRILCVEPDNDTGAPLPAPCVAAARNLTIPEKFRGYPPTGNVRILLSKSAVPFQGPNPPISGCLPLNYL